MEYVNLGHSGLRVSRLCLGMMSYGTPDWRDWVLPESEAMPFIKKALDSGINFFDTADMYSLGVSEQVLGRAIKELAPRHQVVIATKVNFAMSDDPNDRGLSRKHIMDAIDNSLRRLDMDYVDLYQIHRFDRHTPIEETLAALDEVVRSGRARYLGASSMYAHQMASMLHTSDHRGWHRFISMQNHYNLIYREEEREMNPLCVEQGVGLIPWSPLARGFLAGNRDRAGGGDTTRANSDSYAASMYYAESDFDVVDSLQSVAEARGESMAQVALAWLLHKPGVVSPIIGATKMAQLEESLQALDIRLSEEEIEQLEAAYVPHRVLGHS